MRRIGHRAKGSIAVGNCYEGSRPILRRTSSAHPRFETSPAVYDDRNDSWLTREELRAASVDLAKSIASEQKRLVFLLCGVNSETIIGLLAAAAAGHATALIDPAVPEHLMTALIEFYQPELILGARGAIEKLPGIGKAANLSPCRSGAVEWIARESGSSFPPIDPALQLLLSTSGTTGSQKYVQLSRDAVTANARQIAQALAIDEQSVGIAHLPLHYSYGLSVVTSHLTTGGRLCSSMIRSLRRASGRRSETSEDRISPAFPFTMLHSRAWARASCRTSSRRSRRRAERSTFAFRPRSANGRRSAAASSSSCTGRPRPRRAWRRCSTRIILAKQGRWASRWMAVDFHRRRERLGPLPAEAVGTVVYEGPNVMLGYAMSRADLGNGDEMNGRLETGDLGRLDAEGFFT